MLPCFSDILHGNSSNPTISDLKVGVSSGPGTIKGSVSGLSNGTTYFFRSYAKTSEGIIYSAQQTFMANFSCPGTYPN